MSSNSISTSPSTNSFTPSADFSFTTPQSADLVSAPSSFMATVELVEAREEHSRSVHKSNEARAEYLEEVARSCLEADEDNQVLLKKKWRSADLHQSDLANRVLEIERSLKEQAELSAELSARALFPGPSREEEMSSDALREFMKMMMDEQAKLFQVMMRAMDARFMEMEKTSSARIEALTSNEHARSATPIVDVKNLHPAPIHTVSALVLSLEAGKMYMLTVPVSGGRGLPNVPYPRSESANAAMSRELKETTNLCVEEYMWGTLSSHENSVLLGFSAEITPLSILRAGVKWTPVSEGQLLPDCNRPGYATSIAAAVARLAEKPSSPLCEVRLVVLAHRQHAPPAVLLIRPAYTLPPVFQLLGGMTATDPVAFAVQLAEQGVPAHVRRGNPELVGVENMYPHLVPHKRFLFKLDLDGIPPEETVMVDFIAQAGAQLHPSKHGRVWVPAEEVRKVARNPSLAYLLEESSFPPSASMVQKLICSVIEDFVPKSGSGTPFTPQTLIPRGGSLGAASPFMEQSSGFLGKAPSREFSEPRQLNKGAPSSNTIPMYVPTSAIALYVNDPTLSIDQKWTAIVETQFLSREDHSAGVDFRTPGNGIPGKDLKRATIPLIEEFQGDDPFMSDSGSTKALDFLINQRDYTLKYNQSHLVQVEVEYIAQCAGRLEGPARTWYVSEAKLNAALKLQWPTFLDKFFKKFIGPSYVLTLTNQLTPGHASRLKPAGSSFHHMLGFVNKIAELLIRIDELFAISAEHVEQRPTASNLWQLVTTSTPTFLKELVMTEMNRLLLTPKRDHRDFIRLMEKICQDRIADSIIARSAAPETPRHRVAAHDQGGEGKSWDQLLLSNENYMNMVDEPYADEHMECLQCCVEEDEETGTGPFVIPQFSADGCIAALADANGNVRQLKCWRCGEEGHMARDCVIPPDPNDPFPMRPEKAERSAYAGKGKGAFSSGFSSARTSGFGRGGKGFRQFGGKPS
jgi:Zinc knuckle